MKIKTLVSTGQGRLHLIDSAASFKKIGLEVNVITGWMPSDKTPDYFLNLLGRFVGRRNLAYGLRKRTSALLTQHEIKTCTYSEFFIQFLFILSKLKVISRDTAAVLGWRAYGLESKKYIKGCDVFHVRSGAGRGGAIDLAKKLKIKVVVDHSIAHPVELYKQLSKANNGEEPDAFIGPNSLFWKTVVEDCKQADIIQVNSDYVKESFVANGFSKSRISVIHLGVRDDFYDLKKSYLVEDTIKILFTGGFGLRKGGMVIINAISILIEKNINFRLDVVGSLLKDIKIPDWFSNNCGVYLHGHIPQEDLMSYLSKSDMYIFPSYCEGSAQSVKEAMAAGMPVITTKESGAPVIDGQNGIIIKNDSATDLSLAIINLANDQNHRSQIGVNAAKTIKDEHTWGKYAENTMLMYEELIRDYV